jgi:glycosyltransferase involved in cell wall biosynthesis
MTDAKTPMSCSLRHRLVVVGGIGKLHLVQAARELKRYSPETEIVLATSWIPSNSAITFLNAIGLRGITKRLAVRREVASEVDVAMGFLFPELVYHALRRFIGAEPALALGFRAFGRRAARRLAPLLDKDTVVYIRSGAGNGLIKAARHAQARVCVDHSIAHPRSFRKYLARVEAFLSKSDLNPDGSLWKQVLQDCEEADTLIVNSDFVQQTFVENTYDEQKIEVVYLGVPEAFFQIVRPERQDREGFYLLFVGHFDARKGADLIIEMMKGIAELDPAIRLHIAGNISESGQAILDDLGTPPNIVFHGLVGFEKLKDLLSSAGAFVFPSYLEGSARAVSEAMAAGLPVITTPQSGAPIANGVTGVLLEADDPTGWIEAVLNLREDPEVAARISEAARAAIREISGPSYPSNLFCALNPKALQ